MFEWLDRDLAFPIYIQVQDWKDMSSVPEDYEPGRVIISGHCDYGNRINQWFIKNQVRPNDIVCVPLYQGGHLNGGIGTDAKNECYGDNLKALEQLASKCKGVIIGNAYAELTFKHLFMSDKPAACAAAARFVVETSKLAKEVGGHKVWYGLMDYDAAIDCFWGQSIVRDIVNAHGNALITFCGYTMFGGHIPESEGIPHIQDEPAWCPNCEGPPYTKLTEYISGAEWITGIGGKSGLLAGNDILLKSHGFMAGDMSKC